MNPIQNIVIGHVGEPSEEPLVISEQDIQEIISPLDGLDDVIVIDPDNAPFPLNMETLAVEMGIFPLQGQGTQERFWWPHPSRVGSLGHQEEVVLGVEPGGAHQRAPHPSELQPDRTEDRMSRVHHCPSCEAGFGGDRCKLGRSMIPGLQDWQREWVNEDGSVKAGAPPCPGWSWRGERRKDDRRDTERRQD